MHLENKVYLFMFKFKYSRAYNESEDLEPDFDQHIFITFFENKKEVICTHKKIDAKNISECNPKYFRHIPV